MQFATYLTRIILPISICFGIIGNSINIIVLTRPILRNYPSTHYFLALAVNNLFGSTFILTTQLLANGYDIDISTLSLFSCKIVRYFIELCPILSTYFIVLASIDRYYISSPNANKRKLSTVKLARWKIIIMTGVLVIFQINTPILIDLQIEDKLECYIRPENLYYQIYPIIQTFIFDIVGPCLMIIFGILTILNAKSVQVHPVHTTQHRRRTERQLGFMLFTQVSSFIILNLPICVMYVMLSFIPDTSITSTYIFITILSQLLQQLSYTTPFLLYIISGQIFRKEAIRFIYKILGRRFDNRIQPVINHFDTNVGNGSGPAIILRHIYH